MSETIPSESSKDPLWVVAHLYMDDMLDKQARRTKPYQER